MKKPNISLSVVFAALFYCSGANAQAGQTTAGAQEFLSTLANTQAALVKFHVERLNQTLTLKSYRKKMLTGWVLEDTSTHNYDMSTSSFLVKKIGASGDCVTLIQELDFSQKDKEEYSQRADFSSGNFTVEARLAPVFAVAVAPPHRIEWGKVDISRSSGSVGVSTPDARFGRFFLSFSAPDPDMIDRIEYAMKFLKMSCDATASTGF